MYLRKLTHIETRLYYTGAFLSCVQDVGLSRDITLLADSQHLVEEAAKRRTDWSASPIVSE
jgi:hypothetical protein